MDVLFVELRKIEPREEFWDKILEYTKERRAYLVNKLITSRDEKEADRFRGAIKELDHLISPPAPEHTANDLTHAISAGQGGVY